MSSSGPLLVWVDRNCVMAFQDGEPCGYSIFTSLLRNDNTWSPPHRVHSAQRFVFHFDATAMSDGNVVVTWSEVHGSRRRPRQRILVARGAANWSAPQVAGKYRHGQKVRGRRIAVDQMRLLTAAGGTHAAVAWIQSAARAGRDENVSTKRALRYRTLKADGTLAWARHVRLPTTDSYADFHGVTATLGQDGSVATIGYSVFRGASIARGHERKTHEASYTALIRTASGYRRQTLGTARGPAAAEGDAAPSFFTGSGRTVVIWPDGFERIRSAVLPVGSEAFGGHAPFLRSNPLIGPTIERADGTFFVFSENVEVSRLGPNTTSWDFDTDFMPAYEGAGYGPIDAALEPDGSILVLVHQGAAGGHPDGSFQIASYTP